MADTFISTADLNCAPSNTRMVVDDESSGEDAQIFTWNVSDDAKYIGLQLEALRESIESSAQETNNLLKLVIASLQQTPIWNTSPGQTKN